MKYIYCDFERLSTDLNNKNMTSIGNMVQHVYFVINYAEKNNLTPVVKSDVNIGNLFTFKNSVLQEDGNSFKLECAFKEMNEMKTPSILRRIMTRLTGKFIIKQSLLDVHSKSYKSFLVSQNFLKKSNNNNKYIHGHFWHYDLMPSNETLLKYLNVNDGIRKKIISKYDLILEKNSVSVHFRGGDFRYATDGKHLYKKGVILPKHYYKKAIKEVYEKIKNPVFHLFSDEMNTLRRYFEGHNYVLHEGTAYEDWIAISICHNSIQSNSSFSWTASLFTPGLSIQPENGLAFNSEYGSYPYGFKHNNSISISNSS